MDKNKLRFVSQLLLWIIIAVEIIILYFLSSERLFATNYVNVKYLLFFIGFLETNMFISKIRK